MPRPYPNPKPYDPNPHLAASVHDRPGAEEDLKPVEHRGVATVVILEYAHSDLNRDLGMTETGGLLGGFNGFKRGVQGGFQG